ncbi:hypothetical protein [Massilia sp. CFBP9026]|uniref:hypothetical protein n=1 Tax=Massilia sp. CFBP9026 TaxID=3096536 RepID=UPI002A6A5814|nr:hypothetical protein [Massilia sp. CFBP9026]MDY0964328.1 hypothetical protein [Massilia sp. CFBP9026]
MHTAKLDLKHGLISLNLTPIAVDEKGALTESIARLCSPPTRTDEGQTQYRSLKKISIFGRSADIVIEVDTGVVCAITFLFDLIEFFESSVLESKILKACEKSLNVKFISDHPSSAFLEPCEWGQAIFFYDAKQGDLSFDITFERTPGKPTSRS